MTQAQDAKFTALLEFIHGSRGVDFSGYKQPNLMRRTLRRMQVVGMTDFEAYLDYLEVHPEEFTELFNTILINVTQFFRDAAAWETLQHDLLPGLLARKPPGDPIRVWSAGCASGEEPYSIAMLLAEALGPEAAQQRVKIYATDADEDALRQARQASYTARQLEGLPQPLRQKYFEPSGDRLTFRANLRRLVIFGNHNLLQDAPISRLDLLACRNTIMYFNAETQAKLLTRFHFALNDWGLLFLGRAELLLSQTALFTPVSAKHRIFGKATAGAPRHGLVPPRGHDGTRPGAAVSLPGLAFRHGPVAQIVVNGEGRLESANERALALFGLTEEEVGRPLDELGISLHPVDLRPAIDEVRRGRSAVLLPVVERHLSGGQEQVLEVRLLPLPDALGRMLAVTIFFDDVTAARRLQRDLQRAEQELDAACEAQRAGTARQKSERQAREEI